MSTKLALYFTSQGDSSRVLDVDEAPERQEWRIGRTPDNQITFRNVLVSKHHAVIKATFDKETSLEEKCPCYRWEIIDLLSTNGTFLQSPGSSNYRCAPNVPYLLEDRSTIQFGTNKAKVKISFDIDDTVSGYTNDDTDPVTEAENDREDRKPPAPWYAIDMAEVWAWYTGKGTLAQMIFLMLGSAGAALVLWAWSR